MSKDLALEQVEWDLHENPETFIPLEFTQEIKPDLFGLEVAKATEMVSGLSTTLAEREVLKNAYADVIDLEITTETLPIFKELRLKIVKNKTQGIEKWHKTNKAFYLAGGRFVDAVKNKEILINEEMESKLLEAEKYFENLEKQKAKELNDARIERIRPFVEDVTGLDFADFSDEDFEDYLLGKKTRFENAKKEAEAEALRIETERLKVIETNRRRNLQAPYSGYLDLSHLDISELSLEEFEAVLEKCKKAKIEFDKEQENIKAENIRLQKEAEAKEKELEIERAKAKAESDRIEAKLESERKENARIAKELQDKKDADAKAENDRLEKEKELAKAPIKKQLEVWVNNFELPECSVYNATSKEISEKFEAFKKWSINQIKQL